MLCLPLALLSCQGLGSKLHRTAASLRTARRPYFATIRRMSVQGEDLRTLSCAGLCSRDTPQATDEEVQQYLSTLPAWTLSADKKRISRQFTAKNFSAAVAFFGRVAEVANAEGHHPDLHLTNYRDVSVNLSTHAIGGLSKADFILAAKLDALPVDYSPKWLEKQVQQQPAQEATQ